MVCGMVVVIASHPLVGVGWGERQTSMQSFRWRSRRRSLMLCIQRIHIRIQRLIEIWVLHVRRIWRKVIQLLLFLFLHSSQRGMQGRWQRGVQSRMNNIGCGSGNRESWRGRRRLLSQPFGQSQMTQGGRETTSRFRRKRQGRSVCWRARFGSGGRSLVGRHVRMVVVMVRMLVRCRR